MTGETVAAGGFPAVIPDLRQKFGSSMRNGAIMRAMAAILIQSIGMTPGGISPQILIRFNAIHLLLIPTGTDSKSHAAAG